MPGLFTSEMLPPALQDMIKDMPEDKKKVFLDLYMQNMLSNETQGTDVAPQTLPTPQPAASNLSLKF